MLFGGLEVKNRDSITNSWRAATFCHCRVRKFFGADVPTLTMSQFGIFGVRRPQPAGESGEFTSRDTTWPSSLGLDAECPRSLHPVARSVVRKRSFLRSCPAGKASRFQASGGHAKFDEGLHGHAHAEFEY